MCLNISLADQIKVTRRGFKEKGREKERRREGRGAGFSLQTGNQSLGYFILVQFRRTRNKNNAALEEFSL